MLSPTVSAPSVMPPAAFSASAMRAPGVSVTRPGVCTRPTTLTTTGWLGLVEGPGPGLRLPPAALCTGGQFGRNPGKGDRTRGARVGAHLGQPAAVVLRRTVRDPAWQQRVRVGVGIVAVVGLGDRARLGAESAAPA